MAAPDPTVVERKFYTDLLGLPEDTPLSMAELRSLTGGGANAAHAVQAANTTNVQGIGVSYMEYTNVSGDLTIDGRKTTHSLTMTGDTNIDIANPVEGQTISIWATGPYQLFVEDFFVSTNEAVAVYIRGQWMVRLVGASTDSIAPTAGVLTIVVGGTTADASVAGAMDNMELADLPYSFRYATTPDNGVTWNAWGAWTPYQAGATYQYTGLTGGTMYKFQHRVKDAAANVTVGAENIKTTSLLPTWSDKATWTYTAADGTDLNGLAPATGVGVVSLQATVSNTGAVPPINVNVLGNKGRIRADGSQMDLRYIFAGTWARGIGLEMELQMSASNNTMYRLLCDTNGAGSNQVGFTINDDGSVVAYHLAAGSTTYTEVSGVPVPKSATIKVEFSKNPDGSCLGTLYVNGAVKGTIASSGWTWQGKMILFLPTSNQTDSTFDNTRVFAASV